MVTPVGTKPGAQIVEMVPLTDKAGIYSMIARQENFLAVHIPCMSTIAAPLRCLLKSDFLLEHKEEGKPQHYQKSKKKFILCPHSTS